MAKSARSSVVKRNHAKLRATVFGPANDARIERLSAKLQEIAAQPRPEREEEPSMEDNATGAAMDIDSKSTSKSARKTGRIQKRNGKKSRSSIVFPKHPSKVKKTPKKK